MLGDKLSSILTCLSKPELNRLRKFLQSTYFCDEADVLPLFDHCNHALRKSKEAFESLEKKQVWSRLWPERPYNDAHFRRLESDLTQLAIRFMAFEMRADDPVADNLDAQKALNRSGLEKHLTGVERQIIRQLDDSPHRSTQYYFRSFEARWLSFNRSYRVVAAGDYMEKLMPADHYLECFYLVQKLKLYLAWLSFRQFRKTDIVVDLPPGFWRHLENPRFESEPMIVIYRQVIRTLDEPEDEGLFEQLLDYLDRLGRQLAPEDLRECYYMAQNYCALKINKGKFEYYERAFTLFKSMAERGVLLEEGQLAEGVYKNIITSGLRAGQFEWVKGFIETYSAYLPYQIRENARAYNLANLYSHLRQYDNALEVLRSVEYTDLTYALGAKTILLRVYYEQGEYLALDSLMDSFKVFLRRNKQISKTLQREYITFLNLVKRLTTLSGSNRPALESFRAKVMATSYNTPKKWLLDKIDELSGKR